MTDRIAVEMVCARTRKLFTVEFERRSQREKYRPVKVVGHETEVPPERQKGFWERIFTPVKPEPDVADAIGGVPAEAFDEAALQGWGCPHCDFECRDDAPVFGVVCEACGCHVCGGCINKQRNVWGVVFARFDCVCGDRGWRVMSKLPSVKASDKGDRQKQIAAPRTGANRLLAAGKKRPALPSGKQGA